MGICITDRNNKNREKSNLSKSKTFKEEENINNNNNINKSYTYKTINNKSSFKDDRITKPSSESSNLNQKIEPEIYSIEKFGVKVKLKQTLSEPLKFIFHFYNFKCKMLPENNIYIMQIIFDGKEYPLSFGNGNNPSFIFDETIGKEILFNKMSSSYLEIILYTHKNKSKNAQYFKNRTKGEILAGTQLFSYLKIDLLTLALSPEKHDLVLLDPKRKRVRLGRINYNLSCKQIEDISIQVKSFKLNLNNLNYNEISLKLKYENASLSLIKETEYTENFHGTPNNKDNVMIYQYIPLNEFMISHTNSKNNNLIKEKNKSEILLSNKNEEINDSLFDDIDEYDNNSASEILKLHGKMSLTDILNSEITLNLFSVRLNYRTDLEKIKSNDINLGSISNSPTIKPSLKPRNSVETKNMGLMRKKLDQMKSYTFMGMVPLNFYKILYDYEKKIECDSSLFFKSMSSQKYDELNKTLSNSKINSVGIEENLEYKEKKKNEINIFQSLIISAYENVSQIFKEEIINQEGEPIGFIEMNIDIIKLPLIKQTMFGVLTETGFEISSIFLYDNLNITNDLPQELLELIKLKEKFEYEISTNIQQFDFDENLLKIMKQIKSNLEKSIIDESCLYYGYSSDEDIWKGQEVMIDLGLILFELIDKIGLEHRKIGFEILKLILKRSEMDLGTLSVVWFKTIKKSNKIAINNINNKNNIYEYEIRDNFLLERKIIEKFLEFHLNSLNFSFENIIKGKNTDKESRNFTNYYLSVSYCLNPMFREELIKQIYSNINLKDEKYLKYLKNMKKNINIFNEEDNFIKTQSDFILWDNSFYKKLESSLKKFNINKISNDNNISNKYIKNVNSIKEQLSEIKYLACTKDDKKDDLINYIDHNWCNKIKSRGFIFYDYILELLTYIQKELNKIDENKCNSKWTNIPGINKILEIINYDLIVKDAKNYPRQIYEILPIFYSEVPIINYFIKSMITTTNIYDTQSIFSLLNILDYLFNKDYDINNFNKNKIKEKIDYKIIQNSFFAIINTENSLAIAKFIWFYYKNISLLSSKHVNKIITYIFIPYFFTLFFHWSFQIRDIFYYFLIFIINHKIKNLIKIYKPTEKTVKLENAGVFGFLKTEIFGFNDKKEEIQKEEEKINNAKKLDDKKIYFFGNLLEEKMGVINEIKNIINKEKYDTNYNNLIDKNKFKNILEKIPEEYQTNIVLGINHYNKVLNDFEEWEKNNKMNNIDNKNVLYPNREISIIKDDIIQYNYDA